jgi:mRNA interferase MazF
MVNAQRFEIWGVQLNPTQGKERNKLRPCVIISPNELSKLSTVIVAPMTTKGFTYPCRIQCKFQNKKGLILLDQMRAIDKSRLTNKFGVLEKKQQLELCSLIQELFAY